MSDEESLCLCGDNAKEFIKYPVGTKVKLTIEAIVTSVGLEDYYDPSGDGLGDKRPYVEFSIADVSGQKKSYDEMDSSEIEQEIHDVMNSEGTAKPNREDGGSIYDDMKKQERVGRTPTRRPAPVVLR